MQDLLLCLRGSLVVVHGPNTTAHRLGCPAARGILVPWPGIEPTFPCIAVRIANHWTIREAPSTYAVVIYFLRWCYWVHRFESVALLFCAKSLQSCPTLCDPVDCSLPGSSVHGDSPGKKTGVGSHAFVQGIFPPRDGTCISCTARQIHYHRATREAMCILCLGYFSSLLQDVSLPSGIITANKKSTVILITIYL